MNVDPARTQERLWMGERPADDGRPIVDRIATGDRNALAELYSRYQAPLFRYLVQLTGDHGVAEEILQDTLVAVWKSAGSFEGRSSVQSWLIGIARRQAHNTLRRQTLPRADASELAAVPSADPDPADAALAQADHEEMSRALQQLVSAHREVLTLTFVQGFSYREIAQIVGVPEGTVKSRLSNAKRALRTLLRPREEVDR